MTASLHAQAATPAVHDLSHSSTGAGRPFIPVSEMPSPFLHLGEAAAGVVADLATRRTDPSIPMRAPLEDLSVSLTGNGHFRQLVQCWARDEAFTVGLYAAQGDMLRGSPEYDETDRAIHWQSKRTSALRQVIVGQRATNLAEVLLKVLVYLSCRTEPLEAAIDEAEGDLIAANNETGTCDDVVRDSIILDLLRMLKDSGLTVESLCAEGQERTRAA